MPDNKAIVMQQVGVTALAAPWDPTQIEIWSTLDPADTIRIKAEATSLEENGDKVIEVSDVIVHKVQIVDADGVINDALRTILVTPAGKAYAAVSKGVISGIQDLVYVTGKRPPWNPAIKVKLKIGKTRKGFRVFNLIPIK